MSKWEYCILQLNFFAPPGMEKKLETLGADGWELCAVVVSAWVFKRKVEVR